MTLKFLEGFESCRTDSDARSRNILQSTTSALTVSVPSTTGVAGYGLAQLTAANTAHNATPFSGSSQGAIGWWTGLTVNQAWNAGGFSFGVSARSNLGTSIAYASGVINGTANACSSQACFDGTKYWAVTVTGSTYGLATSPDLTNWTVVPAPTTLNQWTTISYLGNGVVSVVPYANSTSTALTVYYTSNSGITWSSQSLGTAAASTSGVGGCVVATGNATYPHAALVTCYASSGGGTNQGGVYVGTLGGTMTQVTTLGGNLLISYNGGRVISGLVVLPMQSGGSNSIYSATASSASLNTTGAWSTATLSTAQTVTDIAYNPVSNLWVLSTLTGIWTFPNTGSAGTAVAPSGAQTITQRYSTVAMTKVWWNGSALVAIGASGHIITSADGITWAESGGHIIPVGTSGTDWRSSFYDGSQYVLFSDPTSACVATSTDGVNNYQCLYTSDKAFSAATSTDVNGICVMPVTQTTAPTNPLTNAITSTTGNKFYVVAPSAVTSGSITAYTALNNWGSTTTNASTNVIATGVTTKQQATHYYELVYTKSTSAVNSFTFQLFVDNVLVYGPTAAQPVAATTDTTSVLFAIIPTTQCVSQVDDVYLNFIDGSGMSGVQGTLNIVAQRPTTDVQAQWVKSGSAASNSLSVATSALSSVPGNYVSSSNAGDKDIYSSSATVPTGYTVKGIQVDAMMTKTSTTNPVVNIGVSSGSTETDSTNVTLSTQNVAQLVSLPIDKDPNGNVAWTNASVQASKFVLNHVT